MRLLLLLALGSVAYAPGAVADTPSWPATGTQLELTWVVHHDVATGGGIAVDVSQVELEAKLGAVVRTVKLGESGGGLSPLDQPHCNGAKRGAGAPPPIKFGAGELAKLVFAGGVVHGFAVKRPTPGELSIVSFDNGNDSCGKAICPPLIKKLDALAIPARVTTLKEQIVLVDKAGKRRSLGCKVD